MMTIDDMLIPTRQADIFWNNYPSEPRWVAVLWRPERDAPEDCEGWHAIRGMPRDSMSMGACASDWLDTIQPEHTFASVLQAGSDTEFFWETVRQFARIEGCPWARTMLEQRKQTVLSPEDLEPYFIRPDGRHVELPMGPFGSSPR